MTPSAQLVSIDLQVRQINNIRPPRFIGIVRRIRGQGRVKVRRIRGEGRFNSELRFDQKYREALTAPVGSVLSAAIKPKTTRSANLARGSIHRSARTDFLPSSATATSLLLQSTKLITYVDAFIRTGSTFTELDMITIQLRVCTFSLQPYWMIWQK